MSIHSDERRLFEVLYGLRAVFHALDVTRAGDAIVIELPYEAGHRFELWLACSTKLRPRIDIGELKTVDVDSDVPKREVCIDGVTLRWPVQQTPRNTFTAPLGRKDEERAG